MSCENGDEAGNVFACVAPIWRLRHHGDGES
jgi:hypothetical protein